MFTIFWPVKLAVWLVKSLLSLLVLLSCALTLAALMGNRSWLGSLSTHFHVQYLLLQLLALGVVSYGYWKSSDKDQSVFKRVETWLNLVLLMFFAGLNLSRIAPYYWPHTPQVDVAAAQKIKIMHLNLFGHFNHDRKMVEAAIQEHDPDVLNLVEYTPSWRQDLEKTVLLRKYPYRVTGRGNIGLYSRRPLKHARLVYADSTRKAADQANIIAQLTLNGQTVTILAAHPASPIQPSHLNWQRTSFEKWIKERPTLGKNLLIVGDLNTAPWSLEFKRLIQETDLRDSQLGFGLQPSWPAIIPPFSGQGLLKSLLALPFGIPIDHILVSPNIQVLSRRTGPFVGSDHLPVIAELTVINKH